MTRWIMLFVVVAAISGCARMSDSLSFGFFSQREAPETSAELPAGALPPATELNRVPSDVPQAPPSAVIDPANTEALESEKVICEEKGGLWSRVGNGRAFTCVSATRDANAFCTAASHCEGYCLARSGTCAPFTPLIGCHDVVSKDGGMMTVCLD